MNVLVNVYICALRKKSASRLLGDSEMYTTGTIANSQTTPTKINKNDVTAKLRNLVEQEIL